MGISLNAKAGRITSLTGIKVILMLLLFVWHSPLPLPTVDLGARTCEMLFLISGFCVAYNYWNNDSWNHISSPIKYWFKKLLQIWPVHLVGFIIDLISSVFSHQEHFFTRTNFISSIINLSLLQAWSDDVQVWSSFNGVSWFASSLLFCYFMAPLLLYLAKKTKYPTVLLIFCLLIRILLEILQTKLQWWGFSISFHVSPVIRCMEFYAGMLLLPIHNSVEKQDARLKNLATIAEVLAIVLYIEFAIRMNEVWLRGYFVALACIPILVFTLNAGAISRFLSMPVFICFSSIQMEFFILHQAVIHVYDRCFWGRIPSVYFCAGVEFVVTVFVSVLYKKIMAPILSRVLYRVLGLSQNSRMGMI